MAALEVVHRRLQQVGLGPLTLELHSNKANKRSLLEELKRTRDAQHRGARGDLTVVDKLGARSEEHTSELQSLMRNSYAVFCLKKKKKKNTYIMLIPNYT